MLGHHQFCLEILFVCSDAGSLNYTTIAVVCSKFNMLAVFFFFELRSASKPEHQFLYSYRTDIPLMYFVRLKNVLNLRLAPQHQLQNIESWRTMSESKWVAVEQNRTAFSLGSLHNMMAIGSRLLAARLNHSVWISGGRGVFGSERL